jgi:hypothetical protein
MKDLAPDLALAIELIEKWDVLWWGRLADGLIQPTPRISQPGMEGLEGFQAWAASRAGSPRSLVAAAVANVSRVVDDLGGVFDYEAEFKDGYFAVRKWYRDVFGAGRYREVADFEVHVGLIHNLVIELIRAVNLVIERLRQADPTLLPGHPLAVVAVGPDHRPVQAVEYSEGAAATPQPYPGLRAFPAAIGDRDPGGFGHRSDDTPREREEFERRVEAVEEKIGPGSAPPPETEPPLCLPAPTPPPAPAPAGGQVPPSLRAVSGVLALFALVLGFLQYPWAVGVAVGLAGMMLRLHRRVWKWKPELWPTLLVLVVAGACGFVAQVVVDGLRGGDGKDQTAIGSDAPPAELPRWQPELQGGLEAFDETYGREWGTAIDFDAQDSLRFKFRLHNDAEEATPPLDVQAAVKEPPEGQPWVVQMFAGPPMEMRPVPYASAVLRPQSRGVENLNLGGFLVPAEGEGEEALDVDSSSWKRLGNPSFEGSTAYRLGRLEAGETKLLTFEGSGWLPENTPYMSGHIHFANQGKDHFQVTGSAVPGERLRFHVLLNNGGWKGIQTRIHVFVLPHPRRGFTVVKAYADLSFDEGNVVGESIVNSRTGSGIGLRVLPGTTSLWGYKGADCKGELDFLHKLPDGISQGGVNVGSVGGFRPRDPCTGAGFVRGVEFEALASSR